MGLIMVRDTAVIGSGYMGGGIAQILAFGGHSVKLADISARIASDGVRRIIEETVRFEAAGLFPAGSAVAVETHVHAAATLEEAVAEADYITEAVPENPDMKRSIIAAIERAAPASAIIASNTSTIPISTLAEDLTHPERLIGAHFGNPVPFVPGVEVIPHAGTADSVIAATIELLASCGKFPARASDVVGFVMNRLQFALFHEATQLVESGAASITEIDTIVRTTFGFRLPMFGPFLIADMAGLDVYASSYESLQRGFPERFATPRLLQEQIDRGRLGTKSGGGFYDIEPDRVEALVDYRNRAYVLLQKLLDELGPAPV
jgi:3-hydroxybutyryl-CoA dehydrogenase